jgi:multimeric flavodoxin WrbA
MQLTGYASSGSIPTINNFGSLNVGAHSKGRGNRTAIGEEEMPARRVLGVVGSPRAGGNTETLIDEALRGAHDAGAETEKVRLPELSIKPCLGCFECLERGECIQKDDFAALREKMLASPLWFLGTPVYFFAPSGQMKTFIDRWISIPRDRTEGKRVLAVVALEDSKVETARTMVEVLDQAVRERRMEFIGSVVAPNLTNVGDAQRHPEHLEAAYRAGRDATALLCPDERGIQGARAAGNARNRA